MTGFHLKPLVREARDDCMTVRQCQGGWDMYSTVDPRLSEPHLSEPSIIRTTKLMIFIAFVVGIK